MPQTVAGTIQQKAADLRLFSTLLHPGSTGEALTLSADCRLAFCLHLDAMVQHLQLTAELLERENIFWEAQIPVDN